MTRLVDNEQLAKIDYVSVADAASLEELSLIERPALASLAVWIGGMSLIDNIPLD